MIQIKVSRRNHLYLTKKIVCFYLDIWRERLNSNALKKYSIKEAWRNIHNILLFFNQTFSDTVLKSTTNPAWKSKGYYEIAYRSWHFAVIVQLDLFGNNVAMPQDCLHEKDYHGDTMQTEPFKMDNADDKSDLVDWKISHATSIISESKQYSILDRIITETNCNFLRREIIA